ncbi:hypothetical protein BDW59DRAFT_178151 [Aspergillus cavernicola]|uniref:Uncharacterized protein n=1 Tax=Aspergillus cavernicola TaxID=176166 RepID=A0ABR4HEF2_9EURO
MASTTNAPRAPRMSSRSCASDNPLQDRILPSVEFTSSYTPPASGILTPTSSVDSSPPGVRQRSTSPVPEALFQNFPLNRETPSRTVSVVEMNAGSYQREPSLNPTPTTHRTTSTYRDLHNATPTSSPAGPSSAEYNQPREQAPMHSLRGVNFSFRNLGLASSAPDENHSESEDGDYTYNIRHEELPQVPIYDTRLQNALRNVRGGFADLSQVMSQSKLVQNSSTAFHKLYKQTFAVSRFAYPVARTVGFIGVSGSGKSRVINSILDHQGLTRSGGDGAACTTVVTEFRGINEDHPDNYTIEADFMDRNEIRELLEELVSSVRKYHTDAFQEVTESEQGSIETTATRALETLSSLFPNQPDLGLEFLSRQGEDAYQTIILRLEEWVIAALESRPGGQGSLRYSEVAENAEVCMQLLDILTADGGSGVRTALWPFIKLIRVYLRSPVLRTGLILADLPGFGDLNYARVRATEWYLRHSCDEVLIVSTITRCTTDESIRRIIRRCREDQPTHIVCTHSEDVDAGESARTASASDAQYICELNSQIMKLGRRIEQVQLSRQQATEIQRLNLGAESADLRLDQFLILRRNRRVTAALSRCWDTRRRIFCVSNTLYSKYRNMNRVHADAYLELSGIRDLRRYCQSIPADAQLHATEMFLENTVPALLVSLALWASAVSEGTTLGRAEGLRGVLHDAEQSLLQSITSRQSDIRLAQNNLDRQFNELIILTIRISRANWKSQAIDTSREWAAWSPGTYAAFCRHFGTYETKVQPHRCWNEEILGQWISRLSNKWDTMLDAVEEQKDMLDEQVSNVFERICDSIEECNDFAPDTLQNLVLNMVTRQRCIVDAIHSALDGLLYATEKIKLDTIGGHDSSYIAGVMRPVYNSCREQRGSGSDAGRKQAMNRHLSSTALSVDFAIKIATDYRGFMARTFNELQEKLNDEIANVTRDLRASMSTEGDASEAGQNPRLGDDVRRRVEALREVLECAQDVVRKVRE